MLEVVPMLPVRQFRVVFKDFGVKAERQSLESLATPLCVRKPLAVPVE